jgi:hypothetical protein
MASFFSQHPYLTAGMLSGPGVGLGAWAGSQPGVQHALFGKKGQQKNLQMFTPQQQTALQQLLSQGMQNMDFGGIENRARQQFQTQTAPSLAERFTSFGGGAGGQRSSAFAPAMMGAGADLESQLAALRGQFGMNQAQMGLQRQFEPMYMQRQPGMLEQGGQSLMSLLPLLAMLA